MHDAYDFYQLVKLSNVQIESIAAFDGYLFVGTKIGHLLIYSVNKKYGEQKHTVQLLMYNKQFSKKPIQQLDVLPEHEILLSLSDNLVSFHNFQKVSVQSSSAVLNATSLPKTRGATLFTLEISNEKSMTGEVTKLARLCVVVKRKLQFYYWKNGEFHDLLDDVELPDNPRAILLCQRTVVLGYKSQYTLLNLDEKTFEKLSPTNGAPEPTITRVDKHVFALGCDTQTILMNTSAQLPLNNAVKWAQLPSAVVCDKPYMIGLLPEAVEVRTIDPNQFIQNMPGVKFHLSARAKTGVVFLSNGSLVWCLQAVPTPQQIKSLLHDKQFELALKVATDSEYECEMEKEKSVEGVRTLFAYHLFSAKQYQESMSHFLALKTNPYDVIKLFPDLLPASSPRPPNPKLTDRDLELGLSALIDYLTEVRRSEGKTKSTLLSVIDTTLVKCYLQINDAMIAPLLRLNMVHFTEAERVLKMQNKVNELVVLYQNNGKHSHALALLKQQQNVEKTVEYLQHLGPDNMALLLEYAEWVAQESPEDLFKIFVEDTSEMEQLPRHQILKFLIHHAKHLAIPYLEHAIDVWNDTSPILHTSLANQYREKYHALQSVPESRQEALKIREKLVQFLEKSDYYTPQTVLDLFPKNDMLEERAIMLGKQGRHEQALAIYVCMLSDVQRAKQYCERVSASRAPGHDEVYILLMRILISPPENWLLGVADAPSTSPSDLATAIDVLLSNPDKINPSQALSVLPDDVLLRDVRPFLEAGLRGRVTARRSSQILKGLVYSEHLQVQDLRMRTESRAVLVTEQHICAICSKRFTNQSVVAYNPSGVVHYGCIKESDQS